MATCEYVVEDATRDMPEITREVDWHPDNTPEENSVTLPDGSRIEVVNPMEIRVVPAENEDEGSSP